MSQSVRPMGRRWAVRGIAILLGATGGVLLLVNAVHNRRHNPIPIRIPLGITAGEVAEGQFTAQADHPHEVEISCVWDDPKPHQRTAITTKHKPSSLDLNWKVSTGGETIAAGDCRDYTYLSSPGTSRRVHDRLFGIAPGAPAFAYLAARGVGRFHARAGTRYEIRAEVGGPLPAMDGAAPSLVVRLDRRVWGRHTSRTLPFGYAGIAALGLAALVALAPGAVAMATRVVGRAPGQKGLARSGVTDGP